MDDRKPWTENELAEAIWKEWAIQRGATDQSRSPSRQWSIIAARLALSRPPADGDEVVVCAGTLYEEPTGFLLRVEDDDIAVEFNDPPVEGAALRPFDGQRVEVVIRRVTP